MTRMMFDARGITPKPCGVRNVAENYLVEFATRFDVVALVNPGMEHLVPSGVSIEVAPKACSRFGPLSDVWVTVLSLRHRPDVFFAAHSFLPPVALLAPRKIFICHDLFAAVDKSFFAKRGRLRNLAQLAFRLLSERSFMRADLIVAPSQAVANTFDELWVKPKRVLVAHNGVRLPPAISSTLHEKMVLFVGNFRSYKGFDLLYEAWRRIAAVPAAGGWRLAVATNEPAESVQAFIEHNGLLDGVEFHSRLDDDALQQLRGQCAICVVPSRKEGFGIPLLEALGVSGHVLYSDIDVFRELTASLPLQDLTTFRAEDPADLAAKLSAVMASMPKTALVRQRDANLELINERYSWAAAAERVASQIG